MRRTHRFLHHSQTIRVAGRRCRLTGRATIVGREDKTKKIQIQVKRTFDRRTGELDGSVPVLLDLLRCLRLWKTLDFHGEAAILTAWR